MINRYIMYGLGALSAALISGASLIGCVDQSPAEKAAEFLGVPETAMAHELHKHYGYWTSEETVNDVLSNIVTMRASGKNLGDVVFCPTSAEYREHMPSVLRDADKLSGDRMITPNEAYALQLSVADSVETSNQ